MSQADLAERARVSLTTMVRMEKGHPGIALWAWLGVMDVLGLLDVFRQMRDPVAEAMARGEGKRVRKATSKNELDF